MKLLVTGGCGFIGSNFINYWLDKYQEDEIVNIDKITYAANEKNVKVNNRYRLVKLDINDFTVEEFIKNCDIVVHFAAESHVDNSINDASEFIKTNIEGTYNLLKYALKYNKRFHHVSTDEVFGEIDFASSDKFNEDTSYNPRNPYSASKASSDHLVRSFYFTHGLPITISNCSNNYGEHQNIEKMIPKVITNILQNIPVPVYGKGENIRDWLYVQDHCRAIDLIIKKGKIGETYCIGGSENDITNIELVNKIIEIMGKGEIKFVGDRKGHDKKYAINWSKSLVELGYKPEYGLVENLKLTIDWYKNNEWFWKKKINMKGIILAGGHGTRLAPMTNITNKHLLPVYDRPMIFYPIETLSSNGIKDIIIITGTEHAGHFMSILGSGSDMGLNITYRIQDQAGGIAEALSLCKDFTNGDKMAVILGDNIFENVHIDENFEGSVNYLKEVDDPHRFGVAELSGDGKIIGIEEKPKNPKTNLAVTGLYLYDADVWNAIESIDYSSRGEMEITDVNNWYIKKGSMNSVKLDGFWSDAGTPESLYRSSEFIRNKNKSS